MRTRPHTEQIVPFVKYEGAGNDFILVDNRAGGFVPDAGRIARLCDRHRGIGADGLMTLGSHPLHDCSMRYYNADGSEGEMCGNGARCFALFAEHLGIGGAVKRFDAADGLHEARLLRADAFSGEVEVGMTEVRAIEPGAGWWALDTGVPHYVEFVEGLDAVDVEGRGRAIRRDLARFPRGTNVNFVEVAGEGLLRIRTYERGVEAETLACGTGCTAAALVANHVLQPAANDFRVEARGGVLRVRFDRLPDGAGYTAIRLSGPARRVFAGSFDRRNF